MATKAVGPGDLRKAREMLGWSRATLITAARLYGQQRYQLGDIEELGAREDWGTDWPIAQACIAALEANSVKFGSFGPVLVQQTGSSEPMLTPQFMAPGPEINTNKVAAYAQSTAAKPSYLVTYFDPVYSTKVLRVSGDPGTSITNFSSENWGSHECHHYSLDDAWNADGSLFYLEERCGDNLCTIQGIQPLYLDGVTFTPKYQNGLEAGGDRRIWHPVNSSQQLYVNGNTINSFVPSSTGGTSTVLATVTGYSNFKLGPFKGYTTNDGNAMAIVATRSSDSHSVAFRYNTATSSKSPDIDLTAAGVDLSLGGEVQISPLGTYIAVTNSSDDVTVYTASSAALIQTWLAGASAGGSPSHFDVTLDNNNDEVAFGVDKNSTIANGVVIKRRFSDGVKTTLVSNSYGSHHSCRNLGRPGWGYITYQDISPSYSPFNIDGEIIAVKLDGSGSVERYVQHRSDISNGYYTQPQAAVSHDGNKVVWKSNWGVSSGPMQCYVALISR